MSPSRTGSLPALPNKPFQAPRRSRASTTSSSAKSPVVQPSNALKTALQRLKEANHKLDVPPRKRADLLYALWAGVLPQVSASSLNSTTLVRATEAIPIEALEGGGNDITKAAIDAVVTEIERVQVTGSEGGAGDEEQDWKEIVAWLQGLAELAARQRRNSAIIEADQDRLLVGGLYHVDDRGGINAGGSFAGPARTQGGGANDEDDFDFGSLLLDDDFLAQLEGAGGAMQDQKKPLPRSDGAPSPHHDSVDLRKMKGGSQSSSLAAAAAAAGASGGTLANGIGGPPSTSGGAEMIPPSQDRAAQNHDDDDDDDEAVAPAGQMQDKAKARAVSPLLRRSKSPAPELDSLRRRDRDHDGSTVEQMRKEELAAETDEAQKRAQLGRENAASRVPVQPPSHPASSARPPTVVRPKAKDPIPKKAQQGLFQRPNFDQQDGNDDDDEVDMLDDEEGPPIAAPSKPKGKTGRRKKAVVAASPPRKEAEEEEEDQLASSDPGAAPPPPAQARKTRKAPRVDAASKCGGGKATKQQKAVLQKVGGKRGAARRDYTSSEEEEKAGSASVRKGKRKAASYAGSASEEKEGSARTRATKARGSLPPPPKRRSTRSASVSTINSVGTAASSRKALKPKDANAKPSTSRSKSKAAATSKKLAAAEVALREKEDKKGKKMKPERERKEGTRKSSRPSIGRVGAKANGIKEATRPDLKAGRVGYKQNQTDGSRCWPVLVHKVDVDKSRIAFATLPGPNTAAPAKIEIVPMILSVPPIASKPDEVPLLPPPRQIALEAAMAFLADTDRYDEWREQVEEEWKRVAAEYGMDGDASPDEDKDMEGGDEEEASGSEDSE